MSAGSEFADDSHLLLEAYGEHANLIARSNLLARFVLAVMTGNRRRPNLGGAKQLVDHFADPDATDLLEIATWKVPKPQPFEHEGRDYYFRGVSVLGEPLDSGGGWIVSASTSSGLEIPAALLTLVIRGPSLKATLLSPLQERPEYLFSTDRTTPGTEVAKFVQDITPYLSSKRSE